MGQGGGLLLRRQGPAQGVTGCLRFDVSREYGGRERNTSRREKVMAEQFAPAASLDNPPPPVHSASPDHLDYIHARLQRSRTVATRS